MSNNRKLLKLNEEQLDVLVDLYCWCKQHKYHLLPPDVTTKVILLALERKYLVTGHIWPTLADVKYRITKKGSRLLTTNYPVATIYNLAEWIERALRRTSQATSVYDSQPVGELRRAMRHMLLQLPLERYPELLIHKVPVIKELAIRQWKVLQNETK